MTVTFRRWWRQFTGVGWVFLKEGYAYPSVGLIWIITESVTTFLMPLVFAAAAGDRFGGMSRGEIAAYYVWLLPVGSFVVCHFMWEIATEIKEGQFTAQLMRPMDFFLFTFVRNLAWRGFRVVLTLPVFLLALWFYAAPLKDVPIHLDGGFWVVLVLGHLVSVFFVLMMSMIALFVQEATSIFELYYIPMLFLSGQIVPVAALPDWARSIAMAFPFYYTTAAPLDLLVGRIPMSQWPQLALIQLAWIAGCLVLGRWGWKQGLRHYTGVGM